MISLAGYKINNEIYKNNRTIVFQGNRLSDNCPVIIKYLNIEYPTSKELSDLTYEYKIMDKISGEGIIKPYALLKCNNSFAIIMEDIDGESIAEIMKSTKLSITEKLLLSIQMTDSLIQVHKENIIHKDVNPSNFIWNRKTNQVKIIDFGISTELAKEDHQSANTMNPDGTLEYISPEQTGRINKPIDYRTDFYSLGITLYELFSGQLPFAGEDESEIVYCHIAKTPVPLCNVNPQIPKFLSDIVMKLISKSAEERYQSASGIKKDLEYCYQLLKSGVEAINFVPGKEDVIERFEVPNKLYGRVEDTKILIKSFNNAVQGHSELVLVGGYSGIGKSSLINEIRRPITLRKGRFIHGKCDQRKCNTPYYGIRQAFQELVRQLLSEPQSSLDAWKQRLMDALGGNGQLITDIIPDLEQIIGLQPQVTELNPIESQNRIQMVFLELIKVFAQKEHPLVIFLDDIQWSDAATINLIYYIFCMDTLKHVLFVCTYRDNEIQAGHRLFQLFEKLRNLNSCTELILKPLDFTAVNNLISETLHSPPDITKPLAELLIKKTNGNPFFTIKLLKSLYLQKAFIFIPEKGQWSFELEKVKNAEISDNVIDLIIKSLKSLPERTINTLKLAACIGSQFGFRTLLLIKNDSETLLYNDI
ncbi:MAG: AAA family ATPase [Bacillota bacterium]|jgi:serine/threonine protein kinase|nr:AAA family ATPase [Bacillota bacterium]